MSESNKIAKKEGAYETFVGSPMSKGLFQFDLWNLSPDQMSGMWDWQDLRESIVKYGVRNSLLTALMPTASTSQILDNIECLSGDTKIYMPCGLTKNIEDMNDKDKVVAWNKINLENSNCYEKLDRGVKNTIKLTFEDGRDIICTPEHKFLTYDKKWIFAKDIPLDTKVMTGIEGTYDLDSSDELNYKLDAGEFTFTMENEQNRYKTLAFARILGYILADGSINLRKQGKQGSYDVIIYMGNNYDTQAIRNDIYMLENVEPTITDTGKMFKIRMHKKLTKAIVSLKDITVGKRVLQDAKIPAFILDDNCPKSVIREFLAGHFGGDGHAPFLSTPLSGYPTLKGVKLSHFIHSNYLTSMITFMNNINSLMVKLGLEPSVIGKPQKPRSDLSNKESVEIVLHVPSGTQFGEKIGFRYCVEKSLRLTAANSYWRYRENIINQKSKVLDESYKYVTNGMMKSKALELARSEIFDKEIPLSENALCSYKSLSYYCKNGGKQKCTKTSQIGMPVTTYLRNINCLSWFDKDKYIIDRNSKELPYFGLRLKTRANHKKINVWDIN
ncbi:hypothetical protein EON73_03265, partial [bacterium]